jgi:hypothetical protein
MPAACFEYARFEAPQQSHYRRRRVEGRQCQATAGAGVSIIARTCIACATVRFKQISEAVMSTKSETSKLKQSNWYDDPRMTDEQRREAVKQFHDWCERKGLLPPQGS